MKRPLVGGDLRNVSLITTETKKRKRAKGGRKDVLARSLIMYIILTLCPKQFSVSFLVAEPEDLYQFQAIQKYFIFEMIVTNLLTTVLRSKVLLRKIKLHFFSLSEHSDLL